MLHHLSQQPISLRLLHTSQLCTRHLKSLRSLSIALLNKLIASQNHLHTTHHQNQLHTRHQKPRSPSTVHPNHQHITHHLSHQHIIHHQNNKSMDHLSKTTMPLNQLTRLHHHQNTKHPNPPRLHTNHPSKLTNHLGQHTIHPSQHTIHPRSLNTIHPRSKRLLRNSLTMCPKNLMHPSTRHPSLHPSLRPSLHPSQQHPRSQYIILPRS